MSRVGRVGLTSLDWYNTQRMITTAECNSLIKYTSTYSDTAGWSLSD